MLAIRHASIITADAVIENGLVLVAGGRIQAIGDATSPLPPGTATQDATGLFLSPGLLDLQVNGGFGLDFTADPATIWDVAAQLPRYGVTGFLPTIITSPPETVRQAQAVLRDGPPAGWVGARPLGLHLEGPFLNPAKKGAHNPSFLRRPSDHDVADWSPDTFVRLVTLAPELPSALDVIAMLTKQSVVVSAGHSMASLAESAAGFDAGARYATHLFNAMPALHHREPGLAAAALADPRVTVGLIPDGLHVHPTLVKLVWQLLGRDRLNLVTDAMAAMGMDPGEYLLGDFRVQVDVASARLPDGTLAGCILSLDVILRAFRAFTGASLPDTLATVTSTPARLLGLDHTVGHILPGAPADLVLMTADGEVVETWVAGESLYRRP
ncbi:MAG: N-acetylglucosamine-6-phosphate deacetylase [Anaerolineae bacterium]|nr:N-acetylglucosamine-6-phosphate deacetylase [Anaerolineales bacterium]MCB8934056.1 N-acetylglucosamine-6-phosphate deacetylase [Promineifilum sp.]MCW5845828.1 N-acetylglucosamine-6-phosphate deacetylase [Anaerolineae bacterium]